MIVDMETAIKISVKKTLEKEFGTDVEYVLIDATRPLEDTLGVAINEFYFICPVLEKKFPEISSRVSWIVENLTNPLREEYNIRLNLFPKDLESAKRAGWVFVI